MRVNSTTALAVRAGFVRPWSGWHFILASVQFTPWKVHFKFRELEKGKIVFGVTHAYKSLALLPSFGDRKSVSLDRNSSR
jgi:hypothetical protein